MVADSHAGDILDGVTTAEAATATESAAAADRAIELRSDNSVGVADYMLEAIAAANAGSTMAYGDDPWSSALDERVSAVFERQAVAFPVISGTAANSLGLASLCPPWGAVLCHPTAHINVNEAAATSQFSGGAALFGVDGENAKISPVALAAHLDATGWGDPHRSQPTVLSLTQPTDLGTVYTLDEIDALREIADSRSLHLHLDGARLANAIVALDCTPADITWRRGVEVFTLGATKNGALSTDAVVTFDLERANELRYRLKRAGHVASKMRFQAVQLDAYLTDGRWLATAAVANEAITQLVAGLAELGIEPLARPDVNMAFFGVADEVADRWEAAGLHFYRMGVGRVRFVTSLVTTADDIATALQRIAAAR